MADELSPLDYLLHRGEAYPATRSAFLNLEILDGPAGSPGESTEGRPHRTVVELTKTSGGRGRDTSVRR